MFDEALGLCVGQILTRDEDMLVKRHAVSDVGRASPGRAPSATCPREVAPLQMPAEGCGLIHVPPPGASPPAKALPPGPHRRISATWTRAGEKSFAGRNPAFFPAEAGLGETLRPGQPERELGDDCA
jgi:hypothetical protein